MLLEEHLIEIYRETVVNSGIFTKIIKELNFTILNEVFYYDETSPSGLRWKVDRFKNKGLNSSQQEMQLGIKSLWKTELRAVGD